jgi:hypothetical protein
VAAILYVSGHTVFMSMAIAKANYFNFHKTGIFNYALFCGYLFNYIYYSERYYFLTINVKSPYLEKAKGQTHAAMC